MSTQMLDSANWGSRGQQEPGAERDWLVITARYTERRDPMGQQLDHTDDANITVRAASMETVDGSLVFRTPTGELSVVFGVGGWLEVVRA